MKYKPKGKSKSTLDPYRDQIIGMLKLRVCKYRIAQILGVHQGTLYVWLKKIRLRNS